MRLKRPFVFLAALALLAGCSGDPYTGGREDSGVPEDQPKPDEDGSTAFESAAEAVRHMGAGWNLGNTLDSHSGSIDHMWIEAWTARTPKDYETAWGQPRPPGR